MAERANSTPERGMEVQRNRMLGPAGRSYSRQPAAYV